MTGQTALKYDVEVKENGRVELKVPFSRGAHLTVLSLKRMTLSMICREQPRFLKQPPGRQGLEQCLSKVLIVLKMGVRECNQKPIVDD